VHYGYIPTETRENSLSTEADLNFVIPKRKMYYTFKKGENMKWPLVTGIFGNV
jgi:carbonic anhydrase